VGAAFSLPDWIRGVPFSLPFHAHASRRTARRPARRRLEQAMVGDGDATAAPLAGARAQPKLHAAPSSGTAMAPFAGRAHAREEPHGGGGGS